MSKAALCLGFAMALLACGAARAGILGYCNGPAALSAGQHDTLLRVSAVIKRALQDSGATLALVARSGLDLTRFNLRYSHAGISLKASPDTPWAVRQLYYACDEGRPRIFDQGLVAFLAGIDRPQLGFVSVLLLPPAAAAALETAAQDRSLVLNLLGDSYSANAYAFSQRHQNCNQWLIELLATAWGDLARGEGLRGRAQQWLHQQAYHPTLLDVGSPLLMWAGQLMPWVHHDDHPAEHRAQASYRVSMPASIEAFVQTRVPGATRLEFCHNSRHVVLRRGWQPIGENCTPAPGDEVTPLAN